MKNGANTKAVTNMTMVVYTVIAVINTRLFIIRANFVLRHLNIVIPYPSIQRPANKLL